MFNATGAVEVTPANPSHWGEFQAYQVKEVVASNNGKGLIGQITDEGVVVSIKTEAVGKNEQEFSKAKPVGIEVIAQRYHDPLNSLAFSDLIITPVGTGRTNINGDVDYRVQSLKPGRVKVSFAVKGHDKTQGALPVTIEETFIFEGSLKLAVPNERGNATPVEAENGNYVTLTVPVVSNGQVAQENIPVLWRIIGDNAANATLAADQASVPDGLNSGYSPKMRLVTTTDDQGNAKVRVIAARGGDVRVAASLRQDGSDAADGVETDSDTVKIFTAKFKKGVSQSQSTIEYIDGGASQYTRLADGKDELVIKITAKDADGNAVAGAAVELEHTRHVDYLLPNLSRSIPAADENGRFKTGPDGVLTLFYTATRASWIRASAKIFNVNEVRSHVTVSRAADDWIEFQRFKVKRIALNSEQPKKWGTRDSDGYITTVIVRGEATNEDNQSKWVEYEKIVGQVIEYQLDDERSTLSMGDLKIIKVNGDSTNNNGQVLYQIQARQPGQALLKFRIKDASSVDGALADEVEQLFKFPGELMLEAASVMPEAMLEADGDKASTVTVRVMKGSPPAPAGAGYRVLWKVVATPKAGSRVLSSNEVALVAQGATTPALQGLSVQRYP